MLAEKKMKRDGIEGTPEIGDRIPYIMVLFQCINQVAGVKGSRNFDNAEDPLYVLENDIPIDFNYYLEK